MLFLSVVWWSKSAEMEMDIDMLTMTTCIEGGVHDLMTTMVMVASWLVAMMERRRWWSQPDEDDGVGECDDGTLIDGGGLVSG